MMQGNPSVIAIPAGKATFAEEDEFRRLLLDEAGRQAMLDSLLRNDPVVARAYYVIRALQIPDSQHDRAAVLILSRVLLNERMSNGQTKKAD